MYYITNKNNQILAADTKLLTLLSLNDVEELLRKSALQELTFASLAPEVLTINSSSKAEQPYTFQLHSVTLSTVFGDVWLHSLDYIQDDQLQEDTHLASTADIMPLLEEEVQAEAEEEEFDLESVLRAAADEDIELNKPSYSQEPAYSPEPVLEASTADFNLSLLADEELTLQNTEIKTDDKSIALLDDEPISIIDSASDETEIFLPIEVTSTEEETFTLLEDEPISIAEASPDETMTTLTQKETPTDDTDTIFSLLEDEPISMQEDKSLEVLPKNDTTPIHIDIAKTSEMVGISSDEYRGFLNEFIDTAISLEKILKGSDFTERKNAIQAMTQLSDILNIPVITQAAKEIDQASQEEMGTAIEKLYNKLARLTTQMQDDQAEDAKIQELDFIKETGISLQEEPEESLEIIAVEDSPLDFKLEIDEEPVAIETSKEDSSLDFEPQIIEEPIAIQEESIQTESIQEESIQTEALPEGSFGTISLDDVKPIHFDFRLEEAANELSLPVELIEEFVHDFIDQAESETVKMLEAYKAGDLDRIQKIGHLLKGASSNLRINPLSDTLYEIQFCENSNYLEKMIKNYWAHFISFKKQIELSSK